MIEHSNGAQYDGGPHRKQSASSLEPVPLLDAATTVSVHVEILRETLDEIQRVAAASGYDADEAVRIVLLSGLGYEAGRLHLDGLNHAANLGTELSAARVDAMVNELAGYHSMYSVLKYKAFKLYKLNQRLEFNNAGLRAQEEMWNEWAERMRREREALSAEVLRLRSLLSEFTLDWEAAGGPELPRGLLEAAQAQTAQEKQPEVAEQEALEFASDEHVPEPPPTIWVRVVRFFRKA